ncbi:class I SAM-dependent methyltransferase [Patescibacteria group bacterium]|nr:class I SAM-dependent methyltransferase [Patescibacteria group bacterium]
MALTEVEQDFLEFVAKNKSKTFLEVAQKYAAIKKEIDFSSSAFKDFTLQSYNLFGLIYTDETDEDLVKSHKFFELLHLYRFLSYESTPIQKSTTLIQKLQTLFRLVIALDFAPIKNYFLRRASGSHSRGIHQYDFSAIADLIIRSMGRPIKRIVDYGCGPAYISYYLARKIREQKGYAPEVHVVDFDTLVLDFVKFRFAKAGIPLSVATVQAGSMYPQLPEHDVCIASEVLEHVVDPVTVIRNISSTLQTNGLLYGNYNDHAHHAFHVSPDLSLVRKFIQENGFIQVHPLLFKKSPL